jgi:uncharacterized protein (DUF2141 family)
MIASLRHKAFATTLACLLAAPAASAFAATVEVHVTGVTAGKGSVKVAVCDQARFLKQCVYTGSAPAHAGDNTIAVRDVPAGSWAVLAYQDENENGELDRNLIGIPSENYGFSRDARGKFGPPSFEDAAVPVRDDGNGAATVAAVKLR